FSESFIDELAAAAQQDPVAYRLRLLKDLPRHRAVLRLAAEKAGWPGFGTPSALAAGRARGIALHESFGSIVAQVVEVSLVGGRQRAVRADREPPARAALRLVGGAGRRSPTGPGARGARAAFRPGRARR